MSHPNTSASRTYQQLPNPVSAYDADGSVDYSLVVSVSPTFPGLQIVKVVSGPNLISLPALNGQLVAIDATLSPKNVIVRAAAASSALTPGESYATVLAGSYTLLMADGTNWRTVPDASGGGASTLTGSSARGLVVTDVPNLAIFTVSGAGRDGITYQQGDLVVLGQQVAPPQNGPHIVGVVAAGVAPLTRPGWWTNGSTIPQNFEMRLSNEGALYGGLTVKTMCVASQVVGTNDPQLRLFGAGAFVNPALSTVAFQLVRGLTSVAKNGAGDFSITGLVGLFDFTKCLIRVTPRDPDTTLFDIFSAYPSSTTNILVKSVTRAGGVPGDCGFEISILPLAP